MIRALLFLAALATSAVAQTTFLHCPSGCLPNAGPDQILLPTGLHVPAQCACNWDTAIVTDLNILNTTPTVQLTGADPTGVADSTAAFQAAIDSGAGVILVPCGRYSVCPTNTSSVLLRTSNQTIHCASPTCTTIVGGSLCSNVFLGGPQAGGSVSTFAHDITIENCGFAGGKDGATMINLSGDDIRHVTVQHNYFDLTSAVPLAGGTSAVGINGTTGTHVDDNEMFNTIAGRGTCVGTLRGPHDLKIRRNRCVNLFNGISVGTGASSTLQTQQVADGIEISGNYFDGMWYTAPVVPTCGTGTTPCVTTGTTYAATTVTVAGLTLGGLCSGQVSATCAALNGAGGSNCTANCPGVILRVMVPKVTSANASTSFFPDTLISDSTINFVTSGVQRGDVVRTTTSLCNGNGQVASSSTPPSCPGSAGTSGWGDGCTCTAPADCSSAVCEPRFAVVVEPQTDVTTALWIEEWLSDTTRRPVASPPLGTPYSVFDPILAEVHDYNSGTGVVNICVGNCPAGPMNGWHDLLGNTTTPTNGQSLEILTRRPNYQAINIGPSARDLQIVSNDVHRSFSDGISVFGYRALIQNNIVNDDGDACFTINGSHNTVLGNLGQHCESSGLFLGCNNCLISNNDFLSNTWGTPNTTGTNADLVVLGGVVNNDISHNHMERLLPIATAKQGILVAGGATSSNLNVLNDNTIVGGYTVSKYRLDKIGLANNPTNTQITNYHGESITTSDVGNTYFVQGGPVTFANLPPTTGLQNSATISCSDCTAACGAGASNGQTCTVISGAWTH